MLTTAIPPNSRQRISYIIVTSARCQGKELIFSLTQPDHQYILKFSHKVSYFSHMSEFLNGIKTEGTVF